MTETEWLACTDPKPMLEFLLGKASDRKMRLFACACCRRIWHLLIDERSRELIEVAEQFIEGEVINQDVLVSAITLANKAIGDIGRGRRPDAEYLAAHAAVNAGCCARVVAEEYNRDAWIYAAENTSFNIRYAVETEGGEHAVLLRDLFGSLPFRPVTIDEGWLRWNNGTVLHLAQTIYDERTFERMPLLADALEDAGCSDPAILDHCRSAGPHVHGCWVLDLLLEKT